MQPTDYYDDGYEEIVHCEHCGARVPMSRATSLDVSTADEYYPELIYFCPTHAELGQDPGPEVVTDGGADVRLCDVKACEKPAIADVLPTNGRTEHRALRCRDCLKFDLNRGWFREWAENIKDDDLATDGGRDDLRCGRCGAVVHEDEAPPGQCAAGSARDDSHDWGAAIAAAERVPDKHPMTDGGKVSSQSSITMVNGRELVHHERGDDRGVYCPDCGQEVTASKGTHPLPDHLEAERAYGWQCSACKNTFPCAAHAEDAPTFNDRMTGLYATFRDGSNKWIPVPARDLEGDHGDHIRSDGGQTPEERMADAAERCATALELIAGMQMIRFDYDEEARYTVEALHEEALFYGRGGEL